MMKIPYLIFAIIIAISCKQNNKTGDHSANQQIVKQELQQIIDSANVKGSILIYDAQKDIFYSNDFEWANEGHLPASTFKIPNSIIALETGIVANDSTILKWDGQKRTIPVWEQDLTLHDAFHVSCVPCYQEIAREIGVHRMNEYLNKLKYEKMMVDSTSIDVFWLQGDSKINQFQQIDFLNRFYNNKLPISERTNTIMKRMMVMEDNGEYKLTGKTGWSIYKEINNGWFVGYVEKKDTIYYFATNIEPLPGFDINTFSQVRKEISFKALEKLKIILRTSNN